MIECEICGEYGHAGETRVCSECMMDLCESCYSRHVAQCENDDFFHFNEIEDVEVHNRFYIKAH